MANVHKKKVEKQDWSKNQYKIPKGGYRNAVGNFPRNDDMSEGITYGSPSLFI